MEDKIREIQDRLKGLGEGNRPFAVLAYVPLFGWIYPFYFRTQDALCQFHGRQAMRLNLVVLAVYFLVWILENFPIISWLFGPGQLLHHLSRAVWILAAGAYLAISAYAAYKALHDESWSIPYLDEYLEKALEQIKGK